MTRANSRDGFLKFIDNAVGGMSIPAKNIASRVALENRNFIEGYRSGDYEIHLHLGPRLNQPEGELLFRAIPMPNAVGIPPHEDLVNSANSFDAGNIEGWNGGQCNRMFGRVCELAKGDEFVTAAGVGIPSRVWLKAPEKVVQSRWVSEFHAVLTHSPTELSLQVVRMGRYGKVDVPNIVRALDGPDSGASRMIERVFDVPEGVTGELADFIRNGGYCDLYECMSGLRIWLEEGRVGLTVEKPISGNIEILKLFLSPSEQGSCA